MTDSDTIYIDLNGFDNYEISTSEPYQIRNKTTKRILKESKSSEGYIGISIGRKKYYIHRLIAKQFKPNPNNYPCVDHINHDRTDNSLDNLAWVSYQQNSQNMKGNKKIEYKYFEHSDFKDEDMIKVEQYNQHKFKNYYYNIKTDKFYLDNGIRYRELHVNYLKNRLACVRMNDINRYSVNVLYSVFKDQYDL